MRKKIKEVEQNYEFINKIINSTDSNLIKKLLLDNIITITTGHDNEASSLFYNYLKRGMIDNEDILMCKQNKSKLVEKSAKIIRYLQFGIGFILKPKKIWNIISIIDKKIILICVPGPKYLDLAIPIYEEIKNSLDLTPVLLYYWKEGKLCKNNFTQINLFDYSIRLNQLFKILKELIVTKREVDNEKKHRNFYNAIYKVIWTSQVINLINEEIVYDLIKKTNKIKAFLFCLPTNNITRSASIIAKEFDIPTFCIKKGLPGYNVENHFINTEYILAKGEQEKETYIKLGFDEKKIKVVGAPFLKEKIKNKSTMNEQIKIFYVDQPLTQYCSMNCKRKIISFIGEKLKNLYNLKLLIKLHPMSRDHEKIYKEEFRIIGFSNYVIYKSNYDLNKVLDISDYVIMHNSTVGFNALFMNKPLIVLSNSFFEGDIGIFSGEHIFFDEKIAFTVRSEQDLQDIFISISKGILKRKNYEDIKSYLKYYIKYTGETASKHIVKFIESKIHESEIGRS